MRRINKTSRSTSRRSASRSLLPGPAKPGSVAIIGAGRMGTALGLALKKVGYTIEVVATKRRSAAQRAARVFGSETLALSDPHLSRMSQSQIDRLKRCSLILIATPDDTIATLAGQLSQIFPFRQISRSDRRRTSDRRVVLHTSGALGSDVLEPMRRAGFSVGSLHPLLSISESESGARLLADAFFAVEGDPKAIRTGKSIVRNLGGESFTIASGRKALYHAAAVTASPNVTALFDIALEMLGLCGLPPSRARRVLLPLLSSTVGNLKSQDPSRALTGTFKRGDAATVQKHLAALRGANVPQALTAYLVLGQRSVAIARKGGASPDRLKEISQILARAAKSSRQ